MIETLRTSVLYVHILYVFFDMTTLNETIQINRPAKEVFAYVADFSTCEEWDATSTESTPLDDQPLGVGSRFKVICEAPVGSIPLEYEITEYEPDHRVVLVGRGRFFEVEDTIVVTPTDTGCELDYTAVFTWKPWLETLVSAMEPGLERMGQASVQKGLATWATSTWSLRAPLPASARPARIFSPARVQR